MIHKHINKLYKDMYMCVIKGYITEESTINSEFICRIKKSEVTIHKR